MSVDLNDLIDSLRREVSPPGSNLYPNSTDDEWLGHLADAFWEARLNGLLPGYTEADGVVLPIDTTQADLGREFQQLVVLYAAYRVTIAKLAGLRTTFNVASGTNKFEIQQSATVARDVLAAIKARLDPVVLALRAAGVRGAVVLDAVIERTYATWFRDEWWLR